ncbi:MAG TPA: signal peptidase II [Gemmatimonadaceae bacterium]|nr:signal peptidase II [Gemmatimonadaceae bacterium]
MRRSNAITFWAVVATITGVDVATKWWAETGLAPLRFPHPVAGEWLRLTLVYNPGAAFGLNVGEYSRWVFMGLTLIALGILGRLYLNTREGDFPRTVALGLVVAGALGNLIDRVRSERGVVDFIDIGFGATRWPTFNVADMAVSSGAVLLAWVLWYQDQQETAAGLARAEGGGRPVPAKHGELS